MSALVATPPQHHYDFGAGRLSIWIPHAGLSITRFEGRFSNEASERFIETIDPIIRASTHFIGLHDWTEAHSFDAAVPARLGAWTIALHAHVGRIVIATKHPLVSMAVRTANLTIKKIEHLPSREAFLEVVKDFEGTGVQASVG